MRNRWADQFERIHRSQACLRGEHEECSHLCGFGGGFIPWRLRFEFGAVLCKCECHSSCPVTGPPAAIPERTWRESCTCPGAEQERQRRAGAGAEFPDFHEYLARSRRRSQTRREAFDAAKAKAADKNREQIRDLYKAELRARGLETPPDEILDAEVDAITGDDSVSFRITAFSKPATRLAKIAGPLGAVVQRQITAAYLRSLAKIVFKLESVDK